MTGPAAGGTIGFVAQDVIGRRYLCLTVLLVGGVIIGHGVAIGAGLGALTALGLSHQPSVTATGGPSYRQLVAAAVAAVLLGGRTGFDRGPRLARTIEALTAELGRGPLFTDTREWTKRRGPSWLAPSGW